MFPTAAPDPASSTEYSPDGHCRYGVAALGTAARSWVPVLGSGWHLNFNVNGGPSPDNGSEFVYTLRMKEGVFDPPLSDVLPAIQANPGSLWLVGSEMEVDFPVTGDNTDPADYAVAYHDAYQFIKQHDPTARVGVGAMSMATPGRLQYLSLVWDSYAATFGGPMPVDVWNIHIYILAERVWSSSVPYHGQIALGTDWWIAKQNAGGDNTRCTLDEVYCIAEHDSLTIFQEQTVAFRSWMKDHGQQNKPLIISEIALLYQPSKRDEFGQTFTAVRVNNFMDAVFAYLENAKDPALGYPADENRLVQQWIWYATYVEDGASGRPSSMLVDEYELLYEPGDPDALTAVGDNYRDWVQAQTPVLNLVAGSAADVEIMAGPDGFGSTPINVRFRNDGTGTTGRPFVVAFYKDAALTQLIGTQTVAGGMPGCAWGYDTHTAELVWDDIPVGEHTFWARIDADDALAESDEADNLITGSVTVSQNPTPVLSAAAQPPDALLHWTEIGIADHYELFRDDTSPYFTPGQAYAEPAVADYLDEDVLASAGAFYYAVRAVDNDGQTYPVSNRVGVFSFPLSVPPPAAPVLSIARVGSDVALSWTAVAAADHYAVFRDTADPYFTPSTPYAEPAGTAFMDADVLQTEPLVAYVVQSVDANGRGSASNRVGAFTFDIVRGE